MKHAYCIVIALILVMLLSGCYAAPVNKDPAESTATTQKTEQETTQGTEQTEVRTYALPEESPYVASNVTYYCPASQGGYYYCSGRYLTYHDVEADISVTMCPQEGCEHNDNSCAAYMGGTMQNLVEYRGKLYAIVKTDDGTLCLMQKEISDGTLKRLAEWSESELTNEQAVSTSVSLLPPSCGKLYYAVSSTALDRGTGEELSAERACYSLDLQTEKAEQLPLSDFEIAGAAGFVVPVAEYDFNEATMDFTETCCELRFYDLSATDYTVIAEKGCDGYVTFSDPSNHYGSKCLYLCNNTLYTLDADTGESTELLTPENRVVNYWLMDNKVFYITNDENGKAYFFYADLNDCVPVQLQNNGNTEYMVFSMSGEGNDYFAADRKVLSKSDFYAENYGD